MIIASRLSVAALSAHIVGLNLTTLFNTIPMGVSVATTTETAVNMAEGNVKRAKSIAISGIFNIV